jgi:hypothetical protein
MSILDIIQIIPENLRQRALEAVLKVLVSGRQTMDSRVRGSDKAAYGHSRAGANPSSYVLESLPRLLKQLLRYNS